MKNTAILSILNLNPNYNVWFTFHFCEKIDTLRQFSAVKLKLSEACEIKMYFFPISNFKKLIKILSIMNQASFNSPVLS